MSELVRSSIVIFGLSLLSFWFVVKSTPNDIDTRQIKSWIQVWLVIVAIFFSSHNIWLAYFLSFIFIYYKKTSSTQNHTYIFLFLICALPFMRIEIPGILGIRYIIELNYPLFLTLILLLPLAIYGKKTAQKKSSTEAILLAYMTLIISLNFRDNTITNALRENFTNITMILVPYYALTKTLKTSTSLKKAFAALLYGLLPMAMIGVFESAKHWHLYQSLSQQLSIEATGKTPYDVRAGILRASATSGGPIVYGYIMTISLGITMFFMKRVNSKYFKFIFILLFLGLISSVARGMWIGFLALLVSYILTGPARIKKLFMLGFSGISSLTLLSFTEFGQKIIDVLPFIGNIRSDTVDYRAQLLDTSWLVFNKNPWFGSPNYREDPILEVMRQGEGIIDIVNSYIHIALSYGIIGLILFIFIFTGLLFRTYKAIKSLSYSHGDLIQMGRMIFSLISATMVMIFTVSSIDYIPIFYWILVGLTAAYLNVVNDANKLTRQQMLT